jgi:nitroreductase
VDLDWFNTYRHEFKLEDHSSEFQMAFNAPLSLAGSRPIDDIIEHRAATNCFDSSSWIEDDDIKRLAELATRAPSAFNLQNWRLHAVRGPDMKAQLRTAAFGQAKVAQAAVTFVVSGEIPDGEELRARLEPAVTAGLLDAATADAWADMARASFHDPGKAREEAIRSATLLGATLMFAAEGFGLSTAPMSGFDRDSVRKLLSLSEHVIPVLLLAVGTSSCRKPRQKPRRAVEEILTLV